MKKQQSSTHVATIPFTAVSPQTAGLGLLLLIATLVMLSGCASRNSTSAESAIHDKSILRATDSLAGSDASGRKDEASGGSSDDAKKFREANAERKRLDAAQEVIETAKGQIGTPYRYGGTSPKTGFDCSGFVKWSFARHGIELPRSSREQMHAGIPVDKADLKPGDLLIFSRRIGSRSSTHAGLYIGEGKFIHSPNAGSSVRIDEVFDDHYSKRFMAARRVILSADEVKVYAEQKRKRDEFVASGAEHSVKRGDTLSGIAQRYGVTVRSIIEANNISRSSLLQVGQKLHIPGPKGVAPVVAAAKPEKKGEAVRADATPKATVRATAKASTRSVPMAAGAKVHVVSPGDTVWSICKRYGVSKKAVLAANSLTERSVLQIGQKLQIPVGKVQADNEEALEPVAVSESRTETTVYRVKQGDTIWSLARSHGVSTKALLEANGLNGKDVLSLGQELRIPVAAAN